MEARFKNETEQARHERMTGLVMQITKIDVMNGDVFIKFVDNGIIVGDGIYSLSDIEFERR